LPGAQSYRASAAVIEPLLDDAGLGQLASAAKLPMLRNLARGAVVEAIGVYEGRGVGPVSSGPRDAANRRRPVTVAVGRTEQPVVLALTSYEPVEWRITATPDAVIKHVLLGGSHDSVVVTRVPVEITKIGGPYTYGINEAGYPAFERGVRQYLGKSIDRFQGAYAGSEFFVGISPQSTRPRTATADAAPPAVTRNLPGGIVVSPGARPHERVIQCGRTTIVCDANDTVICGGRRVPCR
jgi:hypothetical protein